MRFDTYEVGPNTNRQIALIAAASMSKTENMSGYRWESQVLESAKSFLKFLEGEQ